VAELADWLLSKGQIAESAATANSRSKYGTGAGGWISCPCYEHFLALLIHISKNISSVTFF
jgi:hypothetical protein